MERYRIYGFEDCPFCQRAKKLLEAEGIPFSYIEIPSLEERSAFLDARGFEAPYRTFPRVYALEGESEVLVGGYSDLETHVLLGEFQ